MKLTTVLFDLDGTLLPMDTDAFIKLYFGLMAKKLAPHGYEAKPLMGAIWAGIQAMVQNDRSVTNEEVFWASFTGTFGQKALDDKPVFEEFYRKEFQGVQASCGFTPMSRQVLDTCAALGLRVALATNPFFPAGATHSRIRWAGLQPEDFQLVTTYENSGSCKPNLLYYQEVLERLGVRPEECMMVGNDVAEDMIARKLGMRVFLLTPCLLNKHNEDIDQFPHGDFPELLRFIEDQAHTDC